MATKQQQPRQFPIIQFAALVFITITIMAFGNFAKAVLDNYRLDAQKAMWQARVEEEQALQQRLLKEKEFVTTDTHLRQLAHQMGYYAPDEQPITFIYPPGMEEETDESEGDLPQGGELPESAYWEQWWQLFFGELK